MRKIFVKQTVGILCFVMAFSFPMPDMSVAQAAKASALNAAKKTLAVGEKFDINVKNKGKGRKYSYYFEKKQEKNYVTLNKTSGLVTAKKTGKATIVCKATEGKNVKLLKCVITVGPKAVKVVVNNAEGNTSIPVGKEFDFNNTITPKDAVTKSTWSISDSSVFQVNKKNGVVKALKEGKATLTVKNGTVSDSVELLAVSDYSAVQTGAKTIKVTSPVQMKKEDIKVTKSGSNVSLDDSNGVVFSADNREAVITIVSRLTEGTYKVALTKDKVVELKTAAEKVEKIQFLSDKAALMDNKNNRDKAIVGYKITNQFNEDITKRTQIVVSGSHNAKIKENGTILFTQAGGNVFNENIDTVSATMIYTETGLAATANLKVSNARAVSEVSIKGIYNEDKKELNGDTDLDKDDFYLLIDSKDQYGNTMSQAAIGEQVIVSVGSGLTKVTTAAAQNSSTHPLSNKLTLNGVEYMAVKLASTDTKSGDLDPGTFSVMVIAAGSGKSANESVTIKDGIEAVKLTVISSDNVIAEKENVFTYEAVDSYGNAVTDYDVLKRINVTPDGNSNRNKIGMRWQEESSTGNAKLIYKAGSVTADTTEVVTFTLKNFQVSTSKFTVKASAAPAIVTGVDKNDLNKLLNGGLGGYADIDVNLEKIKVEDSYGSAMSADDLEKACQTTDYRVRAKLGTETSPAIQFDIKSALAIGKTSPVFTVKYNPAGMTRAQKATIIIYLEKDGKEVQGSDYELSVSLMLSDNLGSYAVEDIKTVYAASPAGAMLFGAQYGRAVNVTAKKGETLVKILPGDYNVSVPDFLIFNESDGKLYCDRKEKFPEDVTELKGEVVVTINATGESFKKPVVMSNAKSKVVSVALKASQEDIPNGANQVFDVKSLLNRGGIRYTIKDQYDAEASVSPTGYVGFRMAQLDSLTSKFALIEPTITFSDAEGIGFTISNNGTKDASVRFGSALQSKSIKVTLNFDGVTRTFKIYG